MLLPAGLLPGDREGELRVDLVALRGAHDGVPHGTAVGVVMAPGVVGRPVVAAVLAAGVAVALPGFLRGVMWMLLREGGQHDGDLEVAPGGERAAAAEVVQPDQLAGPGVVAHREAGRGLTAPDGMRHESTPWMAGPGTAHATVCGSQRDVDVRDLGPVPVDQRGGAEQQRADDGGGGVVAVVNRRRPRGIDARLVRKVTTFVLPVLSVAGGAGVTNVTYEAWNGQARRSFDGTEGRCAGPQSRLCRTMAPALPRTWAGTVPVRGFGPRPGPQRRAS